MKILDGKSLSGEITQELTSNIEEITKSDVALFVCILQVGNNPASNIYIKNKIAKAKELGVEVEYIKFEENVTQNEVVNKIDELNNDSKITGIILQLPIPDTLDKNLIINSINQKKDIDGLGEKNLAKLLNNDSTGIVPATASVICTLLEKNNIEVEGKNVVVLGRSTLVGKSTALYLINKNATVTICHSKSGDITDLISNADIVVSATGCHGVINDTLLKEGQILVDTGINLINNKIVGDADISEEKMKTLGAISPVPGGVGPMTVISLFVNLIKAYELQK